MDVVICLQRLLRCNLLLFLEVINKDGESQLKSNPCVIVLELSLTPKQIEYATT